MTRELNRPSTEGRARVVRPRDAASLILLRGEGRTLEVLAGRRPLDVQFMPGVYVFPGGAIDPPDRIAWSIESRTEALGAKLARSARAALRETWEEAGILVGRAGGAPPHEPAVRPIEQAYLGRGLVAAMDVLTYVGRAITPSHSFRRFNTRFFLCDGTNVFGEPAASDELEDVGWHPISRCVRGPRAGPHRSSTGRKTPAGSAFAARRAVRPRPRSALLGADRDGERRATGSPLINAAL